MSTPQFPEQPTTPLPDLNQSQNQTQQLGQAQPQGQPYGQPSQPYGQQAQPTTQQPTSYPAQPAQPAYEAQYAAVPTGTTLDKTNTFAFLAIILAFLSPIAGIVFGHMGLSQIKRTGDAGRGIALTGLIISYAYFVFVLLFFIFYIGLLITVFAGLGSAMSGLDSYSSY